jgi:hypothetical protein
METEKVCNCPECERRNREHQESEDLNFAVLIALVPVMVLTLFGNIGLL